ncbi:MAG: hypothetical protein IJ057_09600 [Bacteroidales bacterium]|nr:hypothetical protein [Bacteroidales bacterium]
MQEKSLKKSIVKQNILQFIELKGLTKYEFYKKTRITRGVLDQNNGMSEDNIARFLACFTEIDANWLITGEGSMYRDTSVMSDTAPPDRDEVVRLLREKVADQQRIIDLLDEKLEAVMAGGNTNEDTATAAAG